MKAYRATGTFRSGKHDQPYTLDVVAGSEEEATERVYSCLLYTSDAADE